MAFQDAQLGSIVDGEKLEMATAAAQVAPVFRLPQPSPAAEPPAEPQQGSGVVPADTEDSPSSCGGGGGGEGEGRCSKQPRRGTKHVHFASVEITSIWVADSVLDYNRRSIVVDLSKTPFALFRRDAVMMKQAGTLPGSAPLPPPGLPALPHAQAVRPPGAAAETGPTSPSSSPPSLPKKPCDALWGSESSESSEGHTDMETDDTETDWHSDADSVCSITSETPPGLVDQQLRRGSNSESGPAFYGVWKRTSSEGYEELLLRSGVPKRAVSVAMKKHPVHIIDHDGSYFRLIVKNGLSKVDNTFWIGEEPKQVRHALISAPNTAVFFDTIAGISFQHVSRI